MGLVCLVKRMQMAGQAGLIYSELVSGSKRRSRPQFCSSVNIKTYYELLKTSLSLKSGFYLYTVRRKQQQSLWMQFVICVCACLEKALLFVSPEYSVHFQDEFHTFESPLTLFSGDADVVPMKRDADTT